MKEVDCLIIGYNEIEFKRYEKLVRSDGTDKPLYRDLSLSFFQYDDKKYTAQKAFNSLYYGDEPPEDLGYYDLGNILSPTITYLGSYLNQRGLTFDYINSFKSEKRLLKEKLKQNKIELVAITTTFYVSVLPIKEIVSFIKKHNNEVKIVVGGPFIFNQLKKIEKFKNEEAKQHFFNSMKADFYINSSQGETTLVKLIKSLKNDLPVDEINNLSYKKGDKFISTPIKEENNKLENNMVNWDLFNDSVDKFVGVRTSISCLFDCAFCSFPEFGGEYQQIDLNLIKKEFDALERLGIKSVNIIDDTFNFPPDRFKDILKMMIENEYSFQWSSNFRCQYADREMVELMKESGCSGVFLGIESGNNKILKNMNKKTTVKEYKRGISLLKEYDITTMVALIVGFPGETDKTVQDTIDFVEETKPSYFRPKLWYCDPFAPIYKKRDKYNLKGSGFEWSHKTMDAQTACDYIEEMFVSIDSSIWLPQYNFGSYGVMNLLNRGIDKKKVDNFINAFNDCVADKIVNPEQSEVNFEKIKKLEETFETGYKLTKPITGRG